MSPDNDPLFRYRRWRAIVRVLDIEELKTLPHVPLSHPFVEKRIGSIRRELLDQVIFWNLLDLENELYAYQSYLQRIPDSYGVGSSDAIDR
jgi:putative transposase